MADWAPQQPHTRPIEQVDKSLMALHETIQDPTASPKADQTLTALCEADQAQTVSREAI